MLKCLIRHPGHIKIKCKIKTSKWNSMHLILRLWTPEKLSLLNCEKIFWNWPACIEELCCYPQYFSRLRNSPSCNLKNNGSFPHSIIVSRVEQGDRKLCLNWYWCSYVGRFLVLNSAVPYNYCPTHIVEAFVFSLKNTIMMPVDLWVNAVTRKLKCTASFFIHLQLNRNNFYCAEDVELQQSRILEHWSVKESNPARYQSGIV